MNSKLKNEHTDCFYRAVLGLRNLDECYAFFEDICTVSEIQAMAQRYYVARLLDEAELTSASNTAPTAIKPRSGG